MSLEPDVAGPQTEAAVTPQPAPASAPPVLDAEQRALLRSILNRIVPARSALAGAGDLSVGDSIEHSLAASPRLRRLFLEGLRDVELTGGLEQAFVDLQPAEQTSVLEAIEQRAPAFMAALVEHTYRGYYTQLEVQRRVGFEPRPPQPQGHSLPPFDPALLSQQRQRAPFWRQTT